MSKHYAPHEIGTLVKFPRRTREHDGKPTEWIDQGTINKIEVAAYVIVNRKGELFVRHFDEVIPID